MNPPIGGNGVRTFLPDTHKVRIGAIARPPKEQAEHTKKQPGRQVSLEAGSVERAIDLAVGGCVLLAPDSHNPDMNKCLH